MGQGIYILATYIYAAQPNRQVIKLQLRGTIRPVRLLVDTGAEVFGIKHECPDIPNCRGKKDHDIFFIMGNNKINMLGTSQLEMKNKRVEFLVAKNDFPIDLDGIAGLNFFLKHDTINDIANNQIKLQNEYYRIITNINGYVDREKLIKESLRLNHMNNEEKVKLWNVLRQFTNQFYLPEDPLPVIPGIKYKIITDTENPIFKPQFRLNREIHEQVRKLVKEQLKKGIIEESISPYSAPSHAVPKKIDATGKTKWRLVVDCKKLNEHTPQDNHPLPNTEEILESLGNCKFY